MQRVHADLTNSAYYKIDLLQKRRNSIKPKKNNGAEVKCLLRKGFGAFVRNVRQQFMLRVLFTQPMSSLHISPSCPLEVVTVLQKRLRSRIGATFSIWRRFVALHNYIGKVEITATRILLKRMMRRFSAWFNRRKMELNTMRKSEYDVVNRINAGLRQSRMEFLPRASSPQRIQQLARKWNVFKERIRFRKMARARTQYLQLCGRVFLSISTIRKWRLATLLERRYLYHRSNEIRGLYIQRWFHRMVAVAQQLVNRREQVAKSLKFATSRHAMLNSMRSWVHLYQVQFPQSRLLLLRFKWNHFRKGLLKHRIRRNKMNCWYIMVALSEVKRKYSWAMKKWVDFTKKNRQSKLYPSALVPNTHLLCEDHRNGEVMQRDVDESFNGWLKLSTMHTSRFREFISSIKTSDSDVIFRERMSRFLVKDATPNEIVWTCRPSKITATADFNYGNNQEDLNAREHFLLSKRRRAFLRKSFSVWQHRIAEVLRNKIMVAKRTSGLLSEPKNMSNNLRDRYNLLYLLELFLY